MGGWNIFYALINFAILALGLFFIGKKLVIGMYQSHRESIRQGLESSERAAEKARQMEQQAAQRGEDPVIKKLEKELALLEAGEVRSEEQEEELCRLREAVEADRLSYVGLQRQAIGGKMGSSLSAQIWDGVADIFAADESLSHRLMDSFLPWFEEQLHSRSGMGEITVRDGVLSVVIRVNHDHDGSYTRRVREIIDRELPDVAKDYQVTGDKKLLAGIRVRIGDVLYDGSLKRQLRRAESMITDAACHEQPVEAVRQAIENFQVEKQVLQVGRVISLSDGICHASGLGDAMESELVYFGGGLYGIVMDLEEDDVGIALLGNYDNVHEGDEVYRMGHVVQVPVGEAMIGRVVDALGKPIDGGPDIFASDYRPVESPAPGVINRQPVSVPMQTGIKSIDALFPVGRGQRELIIGDRQTGKSTIALDAIINQRGKDVICIYVAIGQKESTIAGFVQKLREQGAMDYTIVVCANASEAAPMLYIAPYSGTAMGEYFMYKGRDVLIVYDDLSKQAVAYRELSLLLHRPSGREAYPGDIFYLHSRLLERSARLSEELGGGSMTALPIIETQAGDISAYIPTNVISITDGQIFLETELFNSGIRPAVNVGLSVSRVGGSAQLGAMKQVAGHLRLDLAQYRELAAFTEFSSDLDKATLAVLRRGERATEILKQPCHKPMDVSDQIVSVFAANEGYLDEVELSDVAEFEDKLIEYVHRRLPALKAQVLSGAKLSGETVEELRAAIENFCKSWKIRKSIKKK